MALNGTRPDDIRSFQAIDVHAHIGTCAGGRNELIDRFRSADADLVVSRAGAAATRLTVVSSLEALLPRGEGDVLKGNSRAFAMVSGHKELRMWVVVNPLQTETFEQASEMLRHPGCAGIKIHPEEHIYPVTDWGRRIFEFAAREEAIVITHSGERNSMPEDVVAAANDFPEVGLILGHLGCGWDDDPTHQVRAVTACRHGNVYVDTSSAMNVTPGLIEWAAAEIGTERLLFGTDSPLYFAPMQRARINHAEISDSDKRKILCENAERLLGQYAK